MLLPRLTADKNADWPQFCALTAGYCLLVYTHSFFSASWHLGENAPNAAVKIMYTDAHRTSADVTGNKPGAKEIS